MPEQADLILHNGKVVTADEDFSIHRAVVVKDGKIIAVSGDDLAREYSAPRVIDLEGRMVMPGFIDTHVHIQGEARRHINLTKTKSIEEMKSQVHDRSELLGEREWITGYGWSEDELAEQRRPLRSDLDQAARNNPVVLHRAGGHSSVSNSLALELAGVNSETPDPEGGVIEKDDRGELNGIIRERSEIVDYLVPEATPEELRESFVQSLRDLLGLGITGLIQAGVTPEGYSEWEWAYSNYGDELPRAAVQILWPGVDAMKTFGRKTGDGDERLRVGAVKVFVDGGFTGPAAYTLKPYKGQGDYRGLLDMPVEELRSIVMDGHKMGWQLGFHTIGDAAIEIAIDAFADALAESPLDDHRHYVNHFTISPPPGTYEKMAEHRILIAQQPNFTYTLEGRYKDNLDEERVQSNNPLRTPLDYGIFMSLSSDILPLGPMVGLYGAVTRKGMSGTVYGENERLTMEEAIRGYTANGAYFTWEEGIKGTLEQGKLADMIVLSDDLLTIDPERILDVEVEMTILGGKVVYER